MRLTSVVHTSRCIHCAQPTRNEKGMIVCKYLPRPFAPSTMRNKRPCEHFVWKDGLVVACNIKITENGDLKPLKELDSGMESEV